VSPRPFDIVAVGSAAVDHIHRVSMLPRPDDGVAVLDRQISPGGVECNVAAAAAKLGLRVGVIARVGADAGGSLIREDLRQRGVNVSRMQVGGADDTAYTLVFVDKQGRRIMMTGGLGVRGLTLDHADDDYIRRGRVCFTSSYLPWPLLRRVAGVCRARGGPPLVFDLGGPFEDLEDRGLQREHVDEIAPGIELFLTSRESLRSYTGEEALEPGLARIAAKGVRRASVSDGADGLYLFTSQGETRQILHVPAFNVPVVDTTGAGDVLHAALIAEWLLADQPAARAGRFAAAAAALSCQDWGVRSALPTWPEADALAGNRVIG
jgi:sugar/nucleoside kinase (ribokinase family)